MSKNRQETITDIVAEMRHVCHNPTLGVKTNREKSLEKFLKDILLEYVCRIEAAYKRERAAGSEAAEICGKIGEMIGREAACKETVTDCHGLGNAAKMREAFDNIAEYAKASACHTEDAHLLDYLNQIERWAEAALSAQPRNCDRFINAKDALKAFERETGESMAIEFVRWLFADTKGGAE